MSLKISVFWRSPKVSRMIVDFDFLSVAKRAALKLDLNLFELQQIAKGIKFNVANKVIIFILRRTFLQNISTVCRYIKICSTATASMFKVCWMLGKSRIKPYQKNWSSLSDRRGLAWCSNLRGITANPIQGQITYLLTVPFRSDTRIVTSRVTFTSFMFVIHRFLFCQSIWNYYLYNVRDVHLRMQFFM